MKNPNSPASRLKKNLINRWSSEDLPGSKPRFQLLLFAKDVAVFVLLPAMAVVLFKFIENSATAPKRSASTNRETRSGALHPEGASQIIDFRTTSSSASAAGSYAKRSPGSLVRVRLLNRVETYSNVPVHAQIVDAGLGRSLVGGTLIGDAVSDTNFDKINITFKFARDPARENIAVPISARALALDGTLGLTARKKEGFFTRSAIGSAGSTTQDVQGRTGGDTGDFKQVLFKALTAGLLQEFGSETQVEKNRAQVLTLLPGNEFFAELTDFFPGAR